MDFDPDEEEQPDKTAEPEVQGDEPEYEDMIDGPLPGRGLDAGPKYLGRPRFPWAAVWAPPAPLHLGLEGKSGFSNQYVDPKKPFHNSDPSGGCDSRREAKGPSLIPAGSAVTERDPNA